jgi:hypothetical protein
MMARARLNPTPEQRALVRQLSGHGLTQAEICVHLNVRSLKTLRKWYREELRKGRIYSTVEVYKMNFDLAVSGKNPAMTIHWLKTFAGWGPKMEFEAVSKKQGFTTVWDLIETPTAWPEGWTPPVIGGDLDPSSDPL